jgi:hypothetical protein
LNDIALRVFSVKNGNRQIINYDEFEAAVIQAVQLLPTDKPLPPVYKRDIRLEIRTKPIHIPMMEKGKQLIC